MLKDAEEHADEDKQRKEEAEVRNEADSLAFRAQKSLDEYKDKLPGDVVNDVQSRIDSLKKALESNNSTAIKAATEELNTHMQKIGEAMQKASAAGAPQADPAASSQNKGKKNDNIEEAEVEILDGEKK